jgi:hypothetical protein
VRPSASCRMWRYPPRPIDDHSPRSPQRQLRPRRRAEDDEQDAEPTGAADPARMPTQPQTAEGHREDRGGGGRSRRIWPRCARRGCVGRASRRPAPSRVALQPGADKALLTHSAKAHFSWRRCRAGFSPTRRARGRRNPRRPMHPQARRRRRDQSRRLSRTSFGRIARHDVR